MVASAYSPTVFLKANVYEFVHCFSKLKHSNIQKLYRAKRLALLAEIKDFKMAGLLEMGFF